MSERARATDPDVVILDRDHDFTYFAHEDDEQTVRQLAQTINSRGLIAAIKRPLQLRKLGRLTGTDINMVDSFEPGYAEIVRPLTIKELAQKISSTDKAEGK